MSARRRLAEHVMLHALHMLPRHRGRWADAMRREYAEINDDGEALDWALGCAWASYEERMRSMSALHSLPVRLVICFFIFLQAASSFFDAILYYSYRFGLLATTEAMGGMMAGDNYRPYIPALDALPVWLPGVGAGAGLLSLLTIALLLVRPRAAFPIFISALALHFGTWAYAHHLLPPDRYGTSIPVIILFIAIPVASAVALYLLRRPPPPHLPA